MGLRNIRSGKKLKAVITRVFDSDYLALADSTEFVFDWKQESHNEVFKVFLKEQTKNILGLLSLVDYPEEYRIHLNLIEVGKSNVGKNKGIENIAACLIAFACRLSFERGYNGFVSLKPKTRLISLYQDKYGFRQYGRLLAVENKVSDRLIRKYLHDEKK